MLREIKIKDINSLIGSSDKKIRIEATLENQLSDKEIMGLMASSNKKIVFQKEILDNEERKYLKEVIRPFRDRIDSISKTSYFLSDNCFIAISLDDGDESIFLPTFGRDEMYLGMELDREYSLEELGL